MRRKAATVGAGVVPFAASGLLLGLLYNALFYPHTLIEYTEAGTIGVLMGTVAGLAEHLPGVRRWFQRLPLPQAIAIRTAAYSVFVALSLALVLSVEPAAEGECPYFSCLAQYAAGPLFVRDLVYSTLFVFFAALSAHLVLLVGTPNFVRLITGRYRRPREIHAEFMFADVRGSTALAESLGHERYSAVLGDFFTDVSGPIHEARGEVYQYIGDEIVIVWPGRRAEGRWLECFAEMRAAVERERQGYLATYGVVPEFKAGVHAGAVMVTEVGTLQRAYVYHGDVLNTAARIQASCNETGFDLLASAEALSALDPQARARFEPLPPLPLRGKTGLVHVFGLTDARVGGGSPKGYPDQPNVPRIA